MITQKSTGKTVKSGEVRIVRNPGFHVYEEIGKNGGRTKVKTSDLGSIFLVIDSTTWGSLISFSDGSVCWADNSQITKFTKKFLFLRREE